MSWIQDAIDIANDAGADSFPEHGSNVRNVAKKAGFDYIYHADNVVDLRGDGVFHSLPLATRQAPCELNYVVVPRENPDVFRTAHITNPNHAPMLPGPVEVYIGGEFVLSTTLPVVAPHERFHLGLGVEQAIKCARNTHFQEQRSGHAVVAMTELQHNITITLANNLGRSITCTVLERLPQPARDAEVVVEEGTIDPAWTPYDQLKERGVSLEGGRRWQVALDAGERRTLSAAYVVKIYANNELTGGNRREV